MKKKIILIVLIFLVFLSPRPIFASEGLIKPSSPLYFLQTWGETIRLYFTQSADQKLNYLLELSDRRVSEMEDAPTPLVANRYEDHFRELNELSDQVEGKAQAVEEIKAANLRQQEVLAKVYSQVPENAKNAIINAQENSSKHVAQTIERVEGQGKAQEYTQAVAQIQQAERMGQVEQVPMEGSPNANPGDFTPNALRGINQQNQLNPVNSGSENAGGGGGGQMQPVQPIQMNQPPQN